MGLLFGLVFTAIGLIPTVRLALWMFPALGRHKTVNQFTRISKPIAYNPENPSQAVLEPGSTRGAWGTLLIGIVFSAAGVAIVIFNL
ncbi:MAG: hypothetical protein P8Z42_06290 [Anaerolineales bacterium]